MWPKDDREWDFFCQDAFSAVSKLEAEVADKQRRLVDLQLILEAAQLRYAEALHGEKWADLAAFDASPIAAQFLGGYQEAFQHWKQTPAGMAACSKAREKLAKGNRPPMPWKAANDFIPF